MRSRASRISGKARFLFIVYLVVILCSVSVSAIWIEPFIKKVNTDDVQSLVVVTYRFEDSWHKVDVLTGVYDEAGKLREETRHDAAGGLIFEYSYDYDIQGHMISATGRRAKNGEIVSYNYAYKYDTDGNQIEAVGHTEDGAVTSRYTAQYDKKGNLIEGINYEEGRAVSKYDAEYDVNGNLLREAKYTVYNYANEERYQLEYEYIYTYDEHGNLTCEIGHTDGGSSKYEYRYTYNQDGDLIEGISLTVTEAQKDYFSVVIIPHTFTNTNMKFKKVGSYVNIEVDLISRYIAHILKNYSTGYLSQEENIQNENDKSIELRDKLLNERLKKYGFIK